MKDLTIIMRTIKEILEEKIDYKIREILTRNFDNDKYAWSDAHTELKSLISSTHSHLIEEIIKMAGETKIEKAHTYSSENSDVYRAFDVGQADMKNRIITNLSTLIEKKDDTSKIM